MLKIFLGWLLLEKSAKNYATANACGGTDASSSSRFNPQQGVETYIPNDLTVFRDVLQVDSVSLRQPARRYTYRGLKIFTSLALRFQDFQRLNYLNVTQTHFVPKIKNLAS